MEKVTLSPEDYFQSLEPVLQNELKFLDKEISNIMADQPRVLWQGIFWGGSKQTIIGYGELNYKRPKGEVKWFMIGLAAQKNYISLYVNAVDDKQYLAEKYADTLGKVKSGKSSISFKKVADVNLPVLLELIREAKQIMVQHAS